METRDIFPTLCDLVGAPIPDFVKGQTLRPQLENPVATGHAAVAYFDKGLRTIRTDRWRLVTHKDGYVELYDHTSAEKESRNVADQHPEVVKNLKAQLDARFQ